MFLKMPNVKCFDTDTESFKQACQPRLTDFVCVCVCVYYSNSTIKDIA